MMMSFKEFFEKVNDPRIHVIMTVPISTDKTFCCIGLNEEQRQRLKNYLYNLEPYRKTMDIYAVYFEGQLFIGTEEPV